MTKTPAPEGNNIVETENRRGPLHAIHEASGAQLVPFAGWLMPLRYGSDIAEHTAVRTHSGLFDLSHMGEITVSGPQAGQALDAALVGNIDKLALGRARYTMLCAPDGGVLDDLIVYRTGETQFLVVANAANTDVVCEALQDRATGWDARVRDETAEYALLAVQGPDSLAIVSELLEPADRDRIAQQKYYSIETVTVSGVPVGLARTGYTGEDGFELLCAPEAGSTVWNALLAVGAPQGLIPAGLAARDTLRLEAGMPLYGHELTATITPYDAGLGRVVRLEKPGDFVGRDALAALAQTDPQKTLVGLKGAGRRPARAGNAVQSVDGAAIGVLTSGSPSPTLGYPIALAYINSERAGVGTHVNVDIRGRLEPFEIVELPFYRRVKN